MLHENARRVMMLADGIFGETTFSLKGSRVIFNQIDSKMIEIHEKNIEKTDRKNNDDQCC